MKQIVNLLLVGFIALSCYQCTTAQKGDEYDVLVEYMEENDLDIDKVMERKTWIPSAQYVKENIEDYFIIDIRSGDVAPKNGIPDFEDGHIAGAHNTSFENVLKCAKKHNAPDYILVVSEDGQAASAAAVALRLSGYPNTKVLKFGMSGWNKKFDVWTEQLSGFAINHKNWTKEPAPQPETFDSKPVLKTGKRNGEDILAERVAEFLAAGYQTGIEAQEVLGNPDKYYIVNQGTAKSYGKYGRIKGAQQFNYPYIKDVEGHGSLSNYPADQTIVQYCWTGHAANTVAAWMNIMGYDAKGLKYGANALIFDVMTSKKFGKPANYAFVTGK